MAIVVCSSLIPDHRYSFPLLSLQSSISYILHSIFTHISYHYYSLFALQIPEVKQVFKKESVGWKKKKIEHSVLSLWLSWVIISLLCHYLWHCSHCLVCKSILLTYPMPFILGGVSSQYVLLKFVLLTSNAIYTEEVSLQYVLLKFVLLTFNAIYTERVSCSMSFSNIHSGSFLTGFSTLDIQCHCLILEFKWSASVGNLIL